MHSPYVLLYHHLKMTDIKYNSICMQFSTVVFECVWPLDSMSGTPSLFHQLTCTDPHWRPYTMSQHLTCITHMPYKHVTNKLVLMKTYLYRGVKYIALTPVKVDSAIAMHTLTWKDKLNVRSLTPRTGYLCTIPVYHNTSATMISLPPIHIPDIPKICWIWSSLVYA